MIKFFKMKTLNVENNINSFVLNDINKSTNNIESISSDIDVF